MPATQGRSDQNQVGDGGHCNRFRNEENKAHSGIAQAFIDRPSQDIEGPSRKAAKSQHEGEGLRKGKWGKGGFGWRGHWDIMTAAKRCGNVH